ncbi:MAG: diguanylate cyclase [Thermodesulfobacteriota bacterium]
MAALLAVFLAAPPCAAASSGDRAAPPRNVLIIFPFSQDFPVHAQLAKGFREGLLTSGTPVRITYEYLDLERFADQKSYLEDVARFLEAKYGAIKPDVVVSGGALRDFMDAYGQRMFPGVPVVFPKDGNAALEAAGEGSALDECAKSVEIIFRTRPSTKKLYVVLGDSEEERAVGAVIAQVAKRWRDRADFVFTSDMPYAGMLEAVRGAEKDSAVLFVRWLRDAQGVSFLPEDALADVCRVSGAPVYGVVAHSLGSGVVGGYLFSFELFGRRLAEEALARLRGEGAKGDLVPAAGEYAFDWRELKRWNIDERTLPPESRIEFRKVSLWEEHGGIILAGAAVALIETGLIAALVINRAHRRRFEAQLELLNESLEAAVSERTRDLNGANAELVEAKRLLEQMNERLDQASRTDSLTCLYNRRHLEGVFAREDARAQRKGDPYSVIVCDIDFFKSVNDKHGHHAGDELLRQVARMLERAVRPYDTLARWGGEEFILLLPGTDCAQAAFIAERIRTEIMDTEHGCAGRIVRITMTLGVASWHPGDCVDDVIKRADAAMYEGKRSGRNRVVAG